MLSIVPPELSKILFLGESQYSVKNALLVLIEFERVLVISQGFVSALNDITGRIGIERHQRCQREDIKNIENSSALLKGIFPK
jgi:hypothetical protein